jgi:protein-tyrosine phosphatase
MAARGLALQIDTAGLSGDGMAATDATIAVAARRGLDLSAHRSRVLTTNVIAAAGLILGMERLHMREAVVAMPSAWPCAFTLKEFVRRGETVGARRADEPISIWIARVHDGRDRHDLLGSSPLDDITDPTGGTFAEHEDTARELENLLGRLVDLAWPPRWPT